MIIETVLWEVCKLLQEKSKELNFKWYKLGSEHSDAVN